MNPQRAAFTANKPLIETFGARVERLKRAKIDVTREQVMAFVYQRHRNSQEAQRAWAVGLLDTLDRQRQRILVSYFRELDVTQIFGRESASMDELVKQTLTPFMSGEYEQALRNMEAEVQR